jgi:hypothetical protein
VVFDKLACIVNADNIGIYPIMVETEKQMVDEIIRLSKDADYYLNESQKGLRYRKDTGLFEY